MEKINEKINKEEMKKENKNTERVDQEILKKIPKEVREVSQKIISQGFQAYLVGGCLRDLLLKKKPKDWDIATNAKPKEVQRIFPKSFYHNKFGTVVIPLKSKEIKNIEITTFRSEENYQDKRHPEIVKFSQKIEEDLKRRDFTINALALNLEKEKALEIIDLFNGLSDLKKGIIRAVGQPAERFREDALRLLRAIRFSAQLGFKIEKETFSAIKENASLIKYISQERIRDELIRIILSNNPKKAFLEMEETGLLRFILPELEEGIGVKQGGHHQDDVFTHSLLSLQAAAERNFNLEVRLAALFHDIGKPRTKDYNNQGDITFYNHQLVSEKMTRTILRRLRFKNEIINKVCLLVREHMFVYDIGKVKEGAVRRLLRKVGQENIQDLIDLRVADRLGSRVAKAMPYRLRHLCYLLEKVSHDPISLKMLKINGHQVMEILKISPSPRVGLLLNALLVKVLDKPELNEFSLLKEELLKLNKLSDEELRKFKKKLDYKKEEEDRKIREKYYLKSEN